MAITNSDNPPLTITVTGNDLTNDTRKKIEEDIARHLADRRGPHNVLILGPNVSIKIEEVDAVVPPLGVVEDRTHAQRVADGDACDDTTTDGEVEDCR